MCTLMQGPPQVDYGQGKKNGAFNPDSRAPVYQQVERARSDADFARLFAADIMYGKPETGKYINSEYLTKEEYKDERGRTQTREVTAIRTDKVRKGYLYNQNSLNASKSWVPQSFGYPAMRGEDGNWYQAQILRDMKAAKGSASGDYGFMQGKRITDQGVIRMLEGGHIAFSAKGYNGAEIYVPWSEGFTPAKGKAGAPEADNRKQEARNQGNRNRRIVTVGQATPGNVMGGRASGEDPNRNQLG